MSLDDELDIIEQAGETDAEQADEATEVQDVEDDLDEVLGKDAMESDQEKAYDSFMTDDEADYDGFDPFEVEADEAVETEADILNSEGYHEQTTHDLEEEAIEMEIEEVVDEECGEEPRVIRASDEEEFDLGITREGIAETTADLNAIYRDGAQVAAELKDTMADIGEGLSFLKKRR